MPKKEVYSNTDPRLLLLSYIEKNSVTNERVDMSPTNMCLQASAKKLKLGDFFKPHKHKKIERNTIGTNEAWVFISGKVKATFYDIDDRVILEKIFSEGDCVVVYNAGHSFEVIEENTVLYEFKNGPYYGQEADKEFI